MNSTSLPLTSPATSLRVALLQLDTAWMQAEANIAQAERLMTEVEAADLYILPEMWATGFTMSPNELTRRESDKAARWMQHTATCRQCAVMGSLPVCEADGHTWHNRLLCCLPDGSTTHYDKRHLFAYSGEHTHYAAGHEAVQVHLHGLTLQVQICFDLRFPETSRNTLAAPYDVLIYVANWPTSRIAAWTALLQARAIENQALTLGVNRTGTDPACTYPGCSAAFDAYGRTLCSLDNKAQARLLCIDLSRQHHLRQVFPVLR